VKISELGNVEYGNKYGNKYDNRYKFFKLVFRVKDAKDFN
jgi:hypothetical protein